MAARVAATTSEHRRAAGKRPPAATPITDIEDVSSTSHSSLSPRLGWAAIVGPTVRERYGASSSKHNPRTTLRNLVFHLKALRRGHSARSARMKQLYWLAVEVTPLRTKLNVGQLYVTATWSGDDVGPWMDPTPPRLAPPRPPGVPAERCHTVSTSLIQCCTCGRHCRAEPWRSWSGSRKRESH